MSFQKVAELVSYGTSEQTDSLHRQTAIWISTAVQKLNYFFQHRFNCKQLLTAAFDELLGKRVGGGEILFLGGEIEIIATHTHKDSYVFLTGLV